MDEIHRRVARRIRELAKAKRVPLTHLADLSGTSRAQLFYVLRGDRSPTLGWLSKVSDALEVDVTDLLAKPQRGTRT